MSLVGVILSLTVGLSSNIQLARLWTWQPSWKSRSSWTFALACALISGLSCLFGSLSSHQVLQSSPNQFYAFLGSSILISIGIWVLILAVHAVPFAIDSPRSDNTSFDMNQMMFVFIMETMSNLSLGLGVGFTGLNSQWAAIGAGVSAFVAYFASLHTGVFSCRSRFVQVATAFSGALIAAVGLMR